MFEVICPMSIFEVAYKHYPHHKSIALPLHTVLPFQQKSQLPNTTVTRIHLIMKKYEKDTLRRTITVKMDSM